MKIRRHYIALRLAYPHAGDGMPLETTLTELAETLECTHRNMVHLLGRMTREGWLNWSPKRGRGNRSLLTFIAPLEDMQLDEAKELALRGDLRSALSSLQQIPGGMPEPFQEWLAGQFGFRSEVTGRRRTDTLRFPLPGAVETLDPARIHYFGESHLVNQLFDGLLRMDARGAAVLPHLAHAWETDASRTEWTFYLRKGVQFHHGREMTASDVLYSLQRLARLAPDGLYGWVYNGIASMDAADDTTVRIRLRERNEAFLSFLTTNRASIVPHDICEAEGERFGRPETGGSAVGTGPFRLAACENGIWTLDAFGAYFQGRAFLDRVEVWTMPLVQDGAGAAEEQRGNAVAAPAAETPLGSFPPEKPGDAVAAAVVPEAPPADGLPTGQGSGALPASAAKDEAPSIGGSPTKPKAAATAAAEALAADNATAQRENATASAADMKPPLPNEELRQYQVMHNVRMSDAAAGEWQQVRQSGTTCKFVTVNELKEGPLAHPSTRALLNRAINRGKLVELLAGDVIEEASSFWTGEGERASPDKLPPLDNDETALLKKLLTGRDAGSEHHDSDRDETAALTLVTIPQYAADAGLIRRLLARTGIDLHIKLLSAAEFKGNARMSADLLLFAVMLDEHRELRLIDLYQSMGQHMQPESRAWTERTLRRILSEPDEERRKKLFTDIERRLADRSSLLFLYRKHLKTAFHPSVRGISLESLSWVRFRDLWFR